MAAAPTDEDLTQLERRTREDGIVTGQELAEASAAVDAAIAGVNRGTDAIAGRAGTLTEEEAELARLMEEESEETPAAAPAAPVAIPRPKNIEKVVPATILSSLASAFLNSTDSMADTEAIAEPAAAASGEEPAAAASAEEATASGEESDAAASGEEPAAAASAEEATASGEEPASGEESGAAAPAAASAVAASARMDDDEGDEDGEASAGATAAKRSPLSSVDPSEQRLYDLVYTLLNEHIGSRSQRAGIPRVTTMVYLSDGSVAERVIELGSNGIRIVYSEPAPTKLGSDFGAAGLGSSADSDDGAAPKPAPFAPVDADSKEQ